ncbi:putative late blight resistance protein homolog R1A-3 [Coffea arabica]|uniref:Late blight resistance protein homolog R1A-3 n=1 Tax=Coffea arabica TaxID=13443 RepID=A0A6P6V6D7_COFAR|nr:putative late blight resistance protein homolog R1B-17 [Coffea arabica]XP_027098270.1 putative late blight resistance protein homolog R1B-17 [Coffea arabica]
MAHAAVTCLIETIERLACFTCLAFEIDHLQFQLNKSVAGTTEQITNYAEGFRRRLPQTLDLHFEHSRDCALMYAHDGRIKKLINRFQRKLGSPLEWNQIGDYVSSESKLLVCDSITSCSISKPAFRSIKLKQVISREFFERPPGKIIFLGKFLNEFLQNCLKDAATVCNDPKKLECLEGRIVDVAYSTQDVIEDFMFNTSIESKVMNYVICFLNSDPRSFAERLSFKSEVQHIFDKKYGIHQCLQQTLVSIDSIGRELGNIYVDPLTSENEQLGGASVNDSFSPNPNQRNEVVGLDDDCQSIFDRLITVPSRLEIVAIVGMGGIGKTTLARRVFDDLSTVYNFHVRAWATVSQVFRLRDVLLALLCSTTHVTDEIYRKTNEELAQDLYRSLKGKRYLIVMDDIWNTLAWDDVKLCFPDDENASRVLVTTRLSEVAHCVNPNSTPHLMNLLDLDNSWKLLHGMVFGKKSCPLDLVDIGKTIARKCQGLPLAIIVIAGLLSRIRRTSDCWKSIADNVSSAVNTDSEQCIEILALSYNYLPHHLKACFLYMGAFPEDGEIEVKKLIRLWVAEGFLDKQLPRLAERAAAVLSDREAIAENFLEDLIGRNLVLVAKRSFSGRNKTCRIHDLLRELCLREAQRENFMCLIKRDIHCLPAGINRQRRISFHSEFCGDLRSVPAIPHVRSFLMFSLGLGFPADIFLLQLGFKLLRVLDIIFLRSEHFPTQILKLVHLRYLALTATYELPASISKLCNLQTLIIHGPWILSENGESPTIFFEYWNMPWLRHLGFTVTCSLCIPPIPENNYPYPLAPILQTLSTIRLTSCTREVFRSMPYLRRLAICETKEDHNTNETSKYLSSLVHLPLLEALKCSFYRDAKPWRTLPWDAFPSNLRKLTLSWSYLPWEDMTNISRLPKLEVLKLRNYAFLGPEWEPPEDGFLHLKQLLIENSDLVQWNASTIHFPSLDHLVLVACRFLEEIPVEIGEIPTLRLLELHNCSKSAEISAKEIGEQVEGLQVIIRSDL